MKGFAMHKWVSAFTVWALVFVVGLVQAGCAAATVIDDGARAQAAQSSTGTRHWLGPAYWGNRLQDWRFEDGKIQCVTPQGWLGMRTAYDLTRQVVNQDKGFESSVVVSLSIVDPGLTYASNAAAGMVIGVGRGEMDHRSAAIVHEWSGYGAGLFVGVDGTGQVFVVDNEKPWKLGNANAKQKASLPAKVRLVIKSTYDPGSNAGEVIVLPKQRLTIKAFNEADGSLISSIKKAVDPERVLGNIGLASHPGSKAKGVAPALFGFEKWSVAGDAVAVKPERGIGVVLGTQYTLTRKVLKMTAQLMPLGESDPLTAELQVQRAGRWAKAADADVISPGWTATFRVEDWDDTKDTRYRVVYRLPDGAQTHTYTWQGTVRRDPVDVDKIVVAGFTGNHMNSKTLKKKWNGDPKSEDGNWTTGMYFPHADLTERVEQHKPDLLFFSGDQVYEGSSPTFPDRQNIELDYLYKWYLFVISYRDLMKDIPTVTIPDDHDVYQGNVWGQGGRKSPGRDHDGGYVHPATFVEMVHRTQVAHLPDPADATPIKQGISVYHSDVHWGRVSFAVLADRMFKNGCNGQGLPPSGTGRPDHYNNPKFDTADLDIDGMKLLGDRQIAFLEDWAQNWQGIDMKMALSQTVFANMATHHGPGLGHLIADLDSNGWPQTGRNKALGQLRKAFAMHLAGDQHLATLVHHGIDEHEDAVWSFCVPSVANFYPRAWAPEIKNPYKIPENKAFLGDRLDGFKNKVTVYAASNPGKDMGHLPKQLHNGMPGYGIVIVDKAKRTYEAQCWPRYADPTKPEQMYEGWPRTIGQMENYAKKPAGHLGQITVKGADSFVVHVRKRQTAELVYALRVKGDTFKPMVFDEGKHDVFVTLLNGTVLPIWNQTIGGEAVVIDAE